MLYKNMFVYSSRLNVIRYRQHLDHNVGLYCLLELGPKIFCQMNLNITFNVQRIWICKLPTGTHGKVGRHCPFCCSTSPHPNACFNLSALRWSPMLHFQPNSCFSGLTLPWSRGGAYDLEQKLLRICIIVVKVTYNQGCDLIRVCEKQTYSCWNGWECCSLSVSPPMNREACSQLLDGKPV